jgi:23S rRNA (adenine2503-C2)-methyltransferase
MVIRRLLRIFRGIPSKINLIPLNEAPEIPFKKPSEERVKRFQEILMEGGLTAIVRNSKGREISAACGQLQAKGSLTLSGRPCCNGTSEERGNRVPKL